MTTEPIRVEIDDDNVAQLESDELRKLKDAAKLLADMPDVDRAYWLPIHAEQISVAEKVLKAAVRAEQQERARSVASASPSADAI